jgi:hypothetical protein
MQVISSNFEIQIINVRTKQTMFPERMFLSVPSSYILGATHYRFRHAFVLMFPKANQHKERERTMWNARANSSNSLCKKHRLAVFTAPLTVGTKAIRAGIAVKIIVPDREQARPGTG